MVTPILEKLILQGKAEFKTFNAGGSDKSILNIQQHHYIIITDIIYYPILSGVKMVQLNICSEGKKDTVIFRQSLEIPGRGFQSFNPVKIDTFYFHKNDVQFILTDCQKLNVAFDVGLFRAKSVGFNPIFDYGKSGITGSLPLIKRAKTITTNDTINFQGNTIGELNDFNGLQFPAIGLSGQDGGFDTIPLVTINYVEVFENTLEQL